MADGFDGFDDRYKLDSYDLSTIGKNHDGTSDTGITETKDSTWLSQDGHQPVIGFHPYNIANTGSSGKIIRINYELFNELFQGADTDDDVFYKKKPGRLIARHYARKWWKPSTWDREFLVHMLPASAGSRNYPNGKPGKYVSTIGFNPRLMAQIEEFKNQETGYVIFSVRQAKTPWWAYPLCQHPNDAINLSFAFLYISVVISVIGEGYQWPKNVHDFIDGSVANIWHFAAHLVASIK